MSGSFIDDADALSPADTASPRADRAAVNLVVIESDETSRHDLMSQAGSEVVGFATIADLVPYLDGEIVVLVLGPSCMVDGSLPEIEQVLRDHSEIGAILVAEDINTSLLTQALRAGVKDVIAAPIDQEQLAEAIVRATPTKVVATGHSDLAPAGADQVFEADGELGKVITVFSTKGGAGKSVIATNLAVVLADRSEKPVCLVDADLQFGDIAVMLKLSPQHTVADAVNSLDRLDETLIQSLLVTHESSGLLILPAPLEPAFADQIGAPEMTQIIDLLRRFCSHVVVDTPAYFNDVVLGLIEMSDEVLLVAGMDIPNIKNVKIGLQTLRLLNTPMEKLRLILNRSNSKVMLDVGEVERNLQVTADSLIPSDIVVPQAVNRGVPVVQSAPRLGVTKAIEQLADLFAPQPSSTAKSKKRRK